MTDKKEMDKTNNKNVDAMDKNADNDKWGYAVCFGTVITFIAAIGHVNSFGLIYNDFMAATQSTAKSLTTAHGVFSIMLAVGGIILNIACKKISLRTGGLFGAALFTIGSYGTIFITNINQLPLTFGVLQGIGFGIMVPVCYSTINYYYIEKRTTVMSFIKSVQGVILIGYPYFMKMLMTEYGLRGTLLVLAAISLHVFAGMAVMRISVKQTKEKKTANNNENANEQLEDDKLLEKTEKHSVVLINNNNGKIQSYGNDTRNSRKYNLLNVINLNILKDPTYLNICMGQSFVNFSDLTFFMLQPMLLFQYGYSKGEVATCISIGAGADVAGRFVLAVVSYIVPINTRLLYYVATVFTLVLRIVMLQVHQFVWITATTALLGILRAWLHVTSPLVIANYVTHDEFPAAYALFMLTVGLVNLCFSPLIGWLKDVYQDYVPAFYALTLCCSPCLMFWPVEYTLKNK